jgi:mannose-6-phosphate isomerase-like protein (cupin superfamily)
MRPIRPFDLDAIKPGEATEWLVGPADDVDVNLRIMRGSNDNDASETRSEEERFALVLEGEVKLVSGGSDQTAKSGELLFIPAGVDGVFRGDSTAVWADISAPLKNEPRLEKSGAKIVPIDPEKFEGGGFAWQPLIDRGSGSETMRMNVLQVAPGSGSPDYHIHAFCQIYIIQEGEITVDIGKRRYRAGPNNVVFLPEGVVHRNFNASDTVERHVSLLVPEPKEGDIFDFSVTIHETEAEIMTEIPT